jgi:predicted component of type VI protein secretion system
MWHMVTYKTPYDEAVFLAAEKQHQQRQQKSLIKRIEKMGYRVTEAPQPDLSAMRAMPAKLAQVP